MARLNCKKLVDGDNSSAFNKWWRDNGRPFYVPQWDAWVRPATRSRKAVVVGYSRTEDSDVWNLHGCVGRP